MKILLTAFDAFGEESINPTEEILKRIDPQLFSAELIKLQLPTAFRPAFEQIRAAIHHEQPDVVIALGQAGGRAAITPERVAINISDAGIADNLGEQPIDQTIVADGPAAYFSTLPIKEIVSAIQAEGIKAAVSNSAGTFVCNHVMYGLLDLLEREFPNSIGGFIHVPFMTEQTLGKENIASMPLDEIQRGIEIAIESVIASGRGGDDA